MTIVSKIIPVPLIPQPLESALTTTTYSADPTAPASAHLGQVSAGLILSASGQEQAQKLQNQPLPLPPLRAPDFFVGTSNDLAPLNRFTTPVQLMNNCVAETLVNLALVTGTLPREPEALLEEGFWVLKSLDNTLQDIETNGFTEADLENLNRAASGKNREVFPEQALLEAMGERRSLIPHLTAAPIQSVTPDNEPLRGGRDVYAFKASNMLGLVLLLNRAHANPQVLSAAEPENALTLLMALDAGKPVLLSYDDKSSVLGVDAAAPGKHVHLLMRDSVDGNYYVIDNNSKTKTQVSREDIKTYFAEDPGNVAVIINNQPQWPISKSGA